MNKAEFVQNYIVNNVVPRLQEVCSEYLILGVPLDKDVQGPFIFMEGHLNTAESLCTHAQQCIQEKREG